MAEQADPRYPIGRFSPPTDFTSAARRQLIGEIAAAPAALAESVAGLDDGQLDTPYREGGWTVRQLVHHVPDSHLNAYVRFKLALTEERPTIKPYDQARWAELGEARFGAIEPSLSLLDALHRRWVALLDQLDDAQFRRTLVHPEAGVVDLNWLLSLYAWHGRHHAAHVTALRTRMGW